MAPIFDEMTETACAPAASASIAPKVSVVMPVHNGAEYLDAALFSIRQQTFSNFELLAIDDGSEDGSLGILDHHARADERIKISRLTHQGLSNVMNFGIDQARGKYIAIMHSDDIAMPTRLQKQVSFLEAHPRVAVVGSWYDITDGTDRWLTTVQNPSSSALCRETLEDGRNCICNPSAMVCKWAFRKAGAYRQLLWPAEDYDMWLRISEFAEVTNLQEVLLAYRFHFKNASYQYTYLQSLALAAAQESGRRRRRGDTSFLNNVDVLTWDGLRAEGIAEADIVSATGMLYSAYIDVALRARRADVVARLLQECISLARTTRQKHIYVRPTSVVITHSISTYQYLQACKQFLFCAVRGPRYLGTVASRVVVQLLAISHPLNVRIREDKLDQISPETRIDLIESGYDPESKTCFISILGWSPRLVPYRIQTITIWGLPLRKIVKFNINRMAYYQTTEKTGLFFRGFLFNCTLSNIHAQLDKSNISISIE